jgi:3-dehydroquinate synthase
MTHKLICTIPKVASTYEIEVQQGLLSEATALAEVLEKLASRVAIISDTTVAPLYAQGLQSALSRKGLNVDLFVFPSGESNKQRATKEMIEDQLCKKGFGRDTCILAIGGGVVTDVAGFVAATYCRGVPLIMVPTTLLSMVDASIGGKTGVDHPLAKNMIGCIYQPKKVFVDPAVLRTLPLNEFKNGIVEMIKHGLIADSDYFDFLNSHASKILLLEPSLLEESIWRGVLIKKNIVEEDETEIGKRRLLNFGHTIAHAIEHATAYEIAHGEAVAIGMLVEGYMAVELGMLSQNAFLKIDAILKKYALPLLIPTHNAVRYRPELLMQAMTLDKKSLRGKPRFVMLRDIGHADPCAGNYCMPVEEETLLKALRWMAHAFCTS